MAEELQPRQVLQHAANRRPCVMSWGTYQGLGVLAYGAGKSVAILTHNVSLLQVLDGWEEEEVMEVSWCSHGGLLAACTERHVVFYAPRPLPSGSASPEFREASYCSWERVNAITTPDHAWCISWNRKGDEFLVGGDTLVVYTFVQREDLYETLPRDAPPDLATGRWALRLQYPVTSPVYFAEFSPDGLLFVTAGRFDRLVKVWYASEGAFGDFSFVYLRHPRSITTLRWRSCAAHRHTQRNVLLTVCRDHIVRLWSETDSTEEMHFFLCAVIDPREKGLGMAYDWLHPESPILALDTPPATREWAPVPRVEISPSIHTDALRQSGPAPVRSDALDCIVGVHGDGTLLMWTVAGLADRPRRTPRISSILKKARAFSASDADILQLIALNPNVSRSGPPLGAQPVVELSKLAFFCRTGAGNISGYEVDIDPVKQSAVIRLRNRCSGHKFPLVHIFSHSTRPIMATLGQESLHFWDILEAGPSTPRSILNYNSTIRERCQALAWTPTGDVVFMITNEDLRAYELRTEERSGVPLVRSWTLLGSLRQTEALTQCRFLGVLPPSCLSEKDTRHVDHGPGWVHFLIVVGGKGCRVSILRVECSGLPTSQVSFEVLMHCTVVSKAQCITCATRGLSPLSVLQATSPMPYALWTGCADGHVRVWDIRHDPGESQWGCEEIASFPAHDSPIMVLRAAYACRIATVSYTPPEVHIWEAESAPPNFRLEYAIDLTLETDEKENVPCIDWLSLTSGRHLMAVGYGRSVWIYGQPPTSRFTSRNALWVPLLVVSRSLANACTAVRWSPDGSLVVATAHELAVFSKWINNDPPATSVFSLGESVSLPQYHPRVLTEYMLSGDFIRVERTLGNILATLKEWDARQGNTGKPGGAYHVPRLPLRSLMVKEGTNGCRGGRSTAAAFFAEDFRERSMSVESRLLFHPEDAQELAERLASYELPGVTRALQATLLGVIDTFTQMKGMHGGLDDCALHCLLAVKMFQYQRRSRAFDAPNGLTSADIGWALHSESHEALLEAALPPEADWSVFRALGVTYWLRSPTLLRQCGERLAKNQFVARKDPLDAALLYLALGKKSTLVGLLKAVKNVKMYDFLSHNFSTERWKTAALKNAYVLIAQQKFQMAATFFLLGGGLREALSICTGHLQDFQLALFLCRAVEGEGGELYNEILESHILSAARTLGDRWMQSVALWLLRRYEEALRVLVPSPDDDAGVCAHVENENSVEDSLSLRLMIAPSEYHPATPFFCQKILQAPALRGAKLSLLDVRRMLCESSYAYARSGCDLLALETLSKSAEELEESTSSKPNYLLDQFMTPDDRIVENATKRTRRECLQRMFRNETALHLMAQEIVDANEGTEAFEQSLSHLKDDLDFLCDEYAIDKQRLVNTLSAFCRHRGYIKQHYRLLLAAGGGLNLKNALMEELRPVRLMPALIMESSFPNWSATKAAEMAREFFDCVQHFVSCEGVRRFAQEEVTQISIVIHTLLFLSAFALKRHDLLQQCLGEHVFASLKIVRDDSGQKWTWAMAPEIREVMENLGEGSCTVPQEAERGEEKEMAHLTHAMRVQLLDLLALNRFLENLESYLQQEAISGNWPMLLQPGSLLYSLMWSLLTWYLHLELQVKSVVHALPKRRLPFVSSFENIGSIHTRESAQLPRIPSLSSLANVSTDGTSLEPCDDIPESKLSARTEMDAVDFFADAHKQALWKYIEGPNNVRFELPEFGRSDTEVKFGSPIEVYKSKGELLRCVCVNHINPTLVAFASPKGVREVNVAHSLRYRKRSDDHCVLLDEEGTTWEQILFRFPKEERKDVRSHIATRQMSFVERDFPEKETETEEKDAEARSIERTQIVHTLATHPMLPMYLAGDHDGGLLLWHFENKYATRNYIAAPGPRILRTRFSVFGNKFGVSNGAGCLSLWNFDRNERSSRPFGTIQCHTKRTTDFVFLNAGSCIATVGMSSSSRNLAVWDVLLPPHRAEVLGVVCHEGGASVLGFSARHQMLLSGGKNGELQLYDIRKAQIMRTIPAHSSHIRSLAIDPADRFFVTGGGEGVVKVWDLATMNLIDTWSDLRDKHTFFGRKDQMYGVTGIVVAEGGLFTCGADGRLLYRKIKFE